MGNRYKQLKNAPKWLRNTRKQIIRNEYPHLVKYMISLSSMLGISFYKGSHCIVSGECSFAHQEAPDELSWE